MPRTLLLANPENRRAASFLLAAQARNLDTTVLPWLDALHEPARLVDALHTHALLRVESPGENFDVERALLAWGAPDHHAAHASQPPSPPHAISAREALRLSEDRGLILHPRQGFVGLSRFLAYLDDALRAAPAVQPMNTPRDLALMTDKPRCHAHLHAHGVEVPPALPPVSSYDELVAQMQTHGWDRAFVKLFCGSSASGVVAYSQRQGRVSAFTSAQLVQDARGVRLYNSLRVRRYERPADLRAVIDALCREGVHVELWLPKLRRGPSPLDVRVVTIGGQPAHRVVRVGHSPMTNLHLGSQRGDWAALAAEIGPRAVERLEDLCRRAAAAFPQSLYAGLDVLISPRGAHLAVLEANAFGDLLPGISHGGVDTYGAELDAALQRWREVA